MSEEDMSCGCSERQNEEKLNKEHLVELSDNANEMTENQANSEEETIRDIKKQLADGKTELSFERELSDEGFDYLLDLLKPSPETVVTSLDLCGKHCTIIT